MQQQHREQTLVDEKANLQRIVELTAAFQRVFSGTEGEMVLGYIKSMTAGFHRDPYQHAFNAGKTKTYDDIMNFLDDSLYKMNMERLEQMRKMCKEKK